MNDYSYALEKLRLALEAFDKVDNPKDALLNIMISYLGRLVPEEDLPPEIQDEYNTFLKPFEKVSHIRDGEGYLRSIDAMTDTQATVAMNQIIKFHAVIKQWCESSD